MLSSIIPSSEGNERVITLLVNTLCGPANLINVYSPTLTSTSDAKNRFYDELHSVINQFTKEESLFSLGDFNARVRVDHDSWPTCLGKFGTGKRMKMDSAYCTRELLSAQNTKSQHKMSWRHPHFFFVFFFRALK